MACNRLDVLHEGQIIFEEFTLLDLHGMPRPPKKAEFAILMKLFATTYSVDFTPPFLIIRVRDLPPEHQWPVAVAGMPLYLTIDEDDNGFDHGRLVGPGVFRDDIKVPEHKLSDVFDEFLHFLLSVDGIKVQEICYMAHFWKIVLVTPYDLGRLPMKYANMACKYYPAQADHEFDAAYCVTDSTNLVQHETGYGNVLGPGTLLSFSGNRLTNSGMALRERATEEQFITVAAQELPLHERLVYSRALRDQIFGTITEHFDGAGISLV